MELRGVKALVNATLLVVAVAVFLLIQTASPILDATLSARSVNDALLQMNGNDLPVAIFGAPRQTEFGLHFYRNHPVANYERGEIPIMEHLLVVRGKSLTEIQQIAPGRRAVMVGHFPPQKLDFYWLAAVAPAQR